MPAKKERKSKRMSARIIKKDELLALVDDLERQLAASRTVAHNLLAALVRLLTASS